jgi:hypothetical protein
LNAPCEEWLLGFDARALWVAPERTWDAGRRSRYLLREDVLRPLSTDTWVWPSLFGEGLPEEERERLGLGTVGLPDWRGPNPPLWEDLGQLRGCLASLGPAAAERHALLAVSWHVEGGFSKGDSALGPYREPTRPPVREEGWRLLGYDVSEGGLLSGLTNCGYTREEVAEGRRRWGAHLNAHHLFEALEPAFAFRRDTDARVPEHAPFFVFGLWLIAEGP